MMTSATYQVTGMTCEHCSRAVTSEIASLDGVSAVTVELVPGGLSGVTVTSDSPLTAEAVSAALDEAGDYRLAIEADAAGPLAVPSGRMLPVL
jgi:copper chaperone